MTNKALSIFNQLRPLSVGFDDVFDHFESMFDHPTITMGTNYPPYNIVNTGDNKFDIEVALAGYNKKDINVASENNMLVIESKKTKKQMTKMVRSYIKVSLKDTLKSLLQSLMTLRLKALNLKTVY